MVAGLILAVVGGAQMIARYLAGVTADRMGGPGLLLIPSLACGVAVRMSKRKGTGIHFDELLAEVGVDATPFLSRLTS